MWRRKAAVVAPLLQGLAVQKIAPSSSLSAVSGFPASGLITAKLVTRVLVVCVVVFVVSYGCRSTGHVPPSDLDLVSAVELLRRPLPGDLAALYRLRVPRSGGLRMSILTLAGSGRLTVSEPFGSTLSVTAWSSDGAGEVYDLREGCRFAADDVAAILGAGRLPLPQAVRLLGGRLPAMPGDDIRPMSGGRVAVEGKGWACVATLRHDPWRVVRVDDLDRDEEGAWRLELSEHTSSLPGWVRVERGDGRWAELRLIKLQWDTAQELPELPQLPSCDGEDL